MMLSHLYMTNDKTIKHLKKGLIIMSKEKPKRKQKLFRLDDDLAYRLEVFARVQRKSENELVSRYIEEGLRRDENQSTLDVELKKS